MRLRAGFTAMALAVLLTAPMTACSRVSETSSTVTTSPTTSAPETTERRTRKKTGTTTSTAEVATATTRSRATATIPRGAESVGRGTYVVVPDGWELERKDETLLYLNRGATSIRFETAQDADNHDPQEWLNGYVEDHQNEVGFSMAPARRVSLHDSDETDPVAYMWTASGVRDDQKLHSDQVVLWMRADGLVALQIADVSDINASDSLPVDTSYGFERSIVAAPELGPSKLGPAPAALEEYTDPDDHQLDGGFRVVTLPGWEVSESTAAQVSQRTDVASLVVSVEGSGKTEQELIDDAEAHLRALYGPGLTFTKRDKDSEPIAPRFTTTADVHRVVFDFQGTYSPTDSRPIAGEFDLVIRAGGSAARAVKTVFTSAPDPKAEFDAAFYSLFASA